MRNGCHVGLHELFVAPKSRVFSQYHPDLTTSTMSNEEVKQEVAEQVPVVEEDDDEPDEW